MEPENIDWSNIQSIFKEDSTYENIDAPQWIDLSAPSQPVGDDTWFCNSDCKHHKNSEDFSKPTLSLKVKLLGSVTISEILPFRDRKSRNVKQKAIEVNVSSTEDSNTQCHAKEATDASHGFNGNYENQNPNFSTFPLKIKPSMGKKKDRDNTHANSSQHDRKPGLRSTFSSRNLAAGGEVLNQITELCAELKKKLRRNGFKKGSSEKVSGGVSGESKKERVGERERIPLLVVKEGKA